MKHPAHQKQRGFSLLELGIALVVLGLLSMGFVAYWRTNAQQARIQADRDVLLSAERSLVGFAHARFRLPCPDSDNDGVEDCGTNTHVGALPWRTLGLPTFSASQLRYGVYRNANGTAPWADMDLTVAQDRLLPSFTIGATQPALPATPIAANLLNNSNLIDFCYATTLSANAAAQAGALAVRDSGGTRRHVAFTIAAPGLLDADGDGDPFDGLQHSASNTDPTFESAHRPRSGDYDDRVLAMGFDTLFGQLNCGEALSAISHTHVNAAVAAALMKQAMIDYKRQLEIEDLLAGAGVASATASVASATAGLASAVGTSANAIASAILTYGSTSGLIAAATFAVITNTAAIVSTTATLAKSIALKVETANRVSEVQPLLNSSSTLATSVDANARTADNLGF